MSLFALLSPFYSISSAELAPGDLGRVIVASPSPKPWALAASRPESNPHSHDRAAGEIRGLQWSDFAQKKVLPVYALGQRRDEALRVERVRRTLGVILSTSPAAGEGGSGAITISAVVAPLVPFEVEGRPSEFSPALRARVEALMHIFLFPCARNDNPFVPASVIRLDRPQTLVPSPITWESIGIRLSDEVLSLLLATCRKIFASSAETELDEVRSVLVEAMPV